MIDTKVLKDLFEVLNHLKYYKDPCKKCLVSIPCKQAHKHRECDSINNHRRLIFAYESFCEECQEWILVITFLSGVLFVIVTFLFGFWKWYDIIYAFFN